MMAGMPAGEQQKLMVMLEEMQLKEQVTMYNSLVERCGVPLHQCTLCVSNLLFRAIPTRATRLGPMRGESKQSEENTRGQSIPSESSCMRSIALA